MNNEINDDLNKIRDSLSPYCINICKSKCCKFGKLLLQNKNELDLLVKAEKKEQYFKEKILEENPKTKNIYFNHEKIGGCIHLKKNKCMVYNNPHKPQICRDFPIFKVGKYIMTSSFCQAIENKIIEEDLIKIANKHNLKLL